MRAPVAVTKRPLLLSSMTVSWNEAGADVRTLIFVVLNAEAVTPVVGEKHERLTPEPSRNVSVCELRRVIGAPPSASLLTVIVLVAGSNVHDDAALAMDGTMPITAPASAAPSATRRIDVRWCMESSFWSGKRRRPFAGARPGEDAALRSALPHLPSEKSSEI